MRRYAAAADPGELSADAPAARASLLDPHLPHLHQRWEEGCRSTDQLHEEIRARGYRGSLRTLRRHTAQLRQATACPARPPAPAPKKVASWILTPPGKLTDADHAALTRIIARCPEISATCVLVRDFAGMLCHRRGRHLGGLGRQRRGQPRPRATRLRQRPAQGLGRRHRRTHPALQLRRRRRPRQPHQDDQKTNVRTSETRPPAQARPARGLTPSRKVGQSHFLMATDSQETVSRSMVRRRSTVRFRNGAPAQGINSNGTDALRGPFRGPIGLGSGQAFLATPSSLAAVRSRRTWSRLTESCRSWRWRTRLKETSQVMASVDWADRQSTGRHRPD